MRNRGHSKYYCVFLESMEVSDVATTGYFDPEEDRRNDEVNECTGYYYVTCD